MYNLYYRYRIYPTKDQEDFLKKHIGACRWLWNKHVEHFKNKKWITYNKLAEIEEFKWLKNLSCSILQQEDRKFYKFKNSYFEKLKKGEKVYFPKFKKKKNNGGGSLSIDSSFVKFYLNDKKNSFFSLPKLKEKIKLVFHRNFPENSKIKGLVTIYLNNANEWFILVPISIEKNKIKEYDSYEKILAIDVGLKNFITTSDGFIVKYDGYFFENQEKISRLKKILSKKKKNSKRYLKLSIKIAKIENKIKRKRDWFLHNLSKKLVQNCDLLIHEELNLKSLNKNHFAKKFNDCSFGKFFYYLNYKSKLNNKKIIKIPKNYPSSKKCSNCGFIKKDLLLKERNWICPNCHCSHDRDINATKNMLNFFSEKHPEYSHGENKFYFSFLGLNDQIRIEKFCFPGSDYLCC